MWIITDDRPDKSAVIGKGGWVVGRLREELEINSIHVESFSDFLLKKYRMELSNRRLESFINECGLDDDYLLALNNLKTLLELKLKDLYAFDFKNYFKDSKNILNDIKEISKEIEKLSKGGEDDKKTAEDLHMLETFKGADNTNREAIKPLIDRILEV